MLVTRLASGYPITRGNEEVHERILNTTLINLKKSGNSQASIKNA